MAQPSVKPEEEKAIEDQKNQDLLDSPETSARFQQEREAEWEQRHNHFLERHPYLGGYAFLAGYGLVSEDGTD